MSSDVRVEAAARRVVAEGRTWSFELDCRSGGATVELDGSSVRLRPLHWREKVVLARFAGLGPELVEEQFLRLALAEGEPPTGAARAALVALALWLNAPDAEGLPLQPTLLASVTLDVCTAVGLAPADLDERDALEVESLWRAAGDSRVAAAQHAVVPRGAARAGSTRVETGDATRIMIVPDPLPAPEPQVQVEAQAETEAEAAQEPQPARTETPEPVAPVAPPDPAVAGKNRPATVGADSKPPSPPPAAPARSRGRRAAPRSRQAAVQRFQPLAADEVAAGRAAGVVVAPPDPALPPGLDAVARDDATAPQAPPPVGSAWPSRSPGPHRSRAARRIRPSLRDRTTEPWPLPAPVASTPLSTDDVLDELSERLARAAGELGVSEL